MWRRSMREARRGGFAARAAAFAREVSAKAKAKAKSACADVKGAVKGACADVKGALKGACGDVKGAVKGACGDVKAALRKLKGGKGTRHSAHIATCFDCAFAPGLVCSCLSLAS